MLFLAVLNHLSSPYELDYLFLYEKIKLLVSWILAGVDTFTSSKFSSILKNDEQGNESSGGLVDDIRFCAVFCGIISLSFFKGFAVSIEV